MEIVESWLIYFLLDFMQCFVEKSWQRKTLLASYNYYRGYPRFLANLDKIDCRCDWSVLSARSAVMWRQPGQRFSQTKEEHKRLAQGEAGWKRWKDLGQIRKFGTRMERDGPIVSIEECCPHLAWCISSYSAINYYTTAYHARRTHTLLTLP